MPSMRALLRPEVGRDRRRYAAAPVGAVGFTISCCVRATTGRFTPLIPGTTRCAGCAPIPRCSTFPRRSSSPLWRWALARRLPLWNSVSRSRSRLLCLSPAASRRPARQGQAIQEQLRQRALAHDIAVCGPNCYGIANLYGRFVAYAGSLAQPLGPGPIALLFQSGALTHSVTRPGYGAQQRL